MKTSKEQMSKYLEKMQYLQRLCLGHYVQIETRDIDEEVSVDLMFFWTDCGETKCKLFDVREWYDKEYNDRRMKECVDFLSKTLKWI